MNEGPKNGKDAVLQTLASSGDNWVKLGTLALVAISGGGNFFATTKTGGLNAEEIHRTTQEIHELYDAINTSLERQKRIEQSLNEVKRWQQNYKNPESNQ